MEKQESPQKESCRGWSSLCDLRATSRKRRIPGDGPYAKRSLRLRGERNSNGCLRLPPHRFAKRESDRSRRRRRLSATSPFNLPIEANSKLECRNSKQIQITKTQFKCSNGLVWDFVLRIFGLFRISIFVFRIFFYLVSHRE